jgi:hypothetical protein
MTSQDFCYWLQGYFEVLNANKPQGARAALTSKQVYCIQQHLALVFKHEIDPSAGPPEHQAELNKIHAPQPAPTAPKNPSHGPFGGIRDDGMVYRC